MKSVRLFEAFILENDRAELSQKITDLRNQLQDLEQSLRDMGKDENPDPVKMAITQLKIQKNHLKNQMLQLDMKILALKD